MKNKTEFIPISILILVTLVVFWPLQSVFYQQDEWRALGEYFAQNNFTDLFARFDPIRIILADGRLFSAILGYLLLAKFPFNTFPLFIYSLLFHILNTVLVFYLANFFLKNRFLSFLSGLFFSLSSVSTSAITWYATSIGTLPSTTLIVLSLMYFLKGSENNLRKYYLISFILLYLSLFFKETGYFFFILYPFWFLLHKQKSLKTCLKNFWYYFLAFGSIAIFQFLRLSSYTAHTAVFTSNQTNSFFAIILARAFFYPLTSFSLVYIPPEYFLKIAKYFAYTYYPFLPSQHADLLIQSIVGDLLATTLSLLILLGLYVLSAQKDLKKLLILISLSFFTYLPYIILSKDFTYLDSRYYYLGAIPAGILMSFSLSKIKNKLGNTLYFVSLLSISGYLIFSALVTTNHIKQQTEISKVRLSILSQLQRLKPNLSLKNVFYISGDNNYYLSEGNVLPFQQGTGYALITLYGKDDKRLNSFLQKGMLWDLGSQGYIENGQIGFGYFWDKNLLNKTIKENNFSIEDISSFYYDSKTSLLYPIDISKELVK